MVATVPSLTPQALTICALLPQPNNTRFQASSILSGCGMFFLMMLLRCRLASAASRHTAIKPLAHNLLIASVQLLVICNAVVSLSNDPAVPLQLDHNTRMYVSDYARRLPQPLNAYAVEAPRAKCELSRLEDFRDSADVVGLHPHRVQIAHLTAWMTFKRELLLCLR